jgi:hypothetical protein
VISQDDVTKVLALATAFWAEEVDTPQFRSIFQGKEIGHRIADYVDDRTTEMLQQHFSYRHEVDSSGRKRPRSMGDIWIQSEDHFHPVNVKAGETGKNGQPNLVSLTKLLDALMDQSIDSYYLLIVKMQVDPGPDPLVPTVTPHVYFVDMLDHLEFVTFDSGPGQAMLKEKQFYEAAVSGWTPPVATVSDKVAQLVELLEDGDRRLLENRRNKMIRIRKRFSEFQENDSFSLNQGQLDLG